MATNTFTRRPQAKFMAKIYRDSKAFSCNEFNFDRTLGNYHVHHHLAELNGDIDCPQDVFYRHHGNQPLIFFTLGFVNDDLGWNGFIHFTTPYSDDVRSYIQKHACVLDVVVAYHDPYTGLYHFVVDTHADDLSEENFRLQRKQIAKDLSKHIDDLLPRYFNYYVRALPADCYDILNRDALFGEEVVVSEGFNEVSKVTNPETAECMKPETCEASETSETLNARTCKPMPVGDIIKTFFGRIFNH